VQMHALESRNWKLITRQLDSVVLESLEVVVSPEQERHLLYRPEKGIFLLFGATANIDSCVMLFGV
jgi:hypothetical protein